MRKKNYGVFRLIITLFIILIPSTFLNSTSTTSFEKPIIIDHACTDITFVPEYWIKKAKSEFRIAYGHTSHGSQIISGMQVLMEKSSLYSFNKDGTDGALSIHDRVPPGDLGNPNRTEWYYRTRELLNDPNNDRNMIIWSWCGQVSSASQKDIDTYLNLMNQLEEDYPNVIFVYMTGHLDGTGEEGNLNKRNNQIREFCFNKNKILFDFADIESYDPDGNYFLDKYADDECNYDSDGDGSRDANWADQWCLAHPGECSLCLCAHSRSLNCENKAKAFWWMVAKLAGLGEKVDDCDYNQDGIVDEEDIKKKRKDLMQEYFYWLKDCWWPMRECADFNQDGVINHLDKVVKRINLWHQYFNWLYGCKLIENTFYRELKLRKLENFIN